jgi:hypothetical protein
MLAQNYIKFDLRSKWSHYVCTHQSVQRNLLCTFYAQDLRLQPGISHELQGHTHECEQIPTEKQLQGVGWIWGGGQWQTSYSPNWFPFLLNTQLDSISQSSLMLESLHPRRWTMSQSDGNNLESSSWEAPIVGYYPFPVSYWDTEDPAKGSETLWIPQPQYGRDIGKTTPNMNTHYINQGSPEKQNQ